jgi:hypothetical protein
MSLRPANEVSWLPPPPRRSRVRSRVILWSAAGLALLVLLVGGYTIWWLDAAEELRSETLAWVEQRRAEGWHLAYTDIRRRGYPDTLGVHFEKPELSPPGEADWRWRASRLRLTVPIFGTRSPRLALRGDQSVEFVEAGSTGRWAGRAEQISFDLQPADGWMPNGRLAVRSLALTDEKGETIGIGRLDVVSTGDPAAAATADVSTWGVRVAAEQLRLPKTFSTACGGEIDSLKADAELYGPLAPRPWPLALAKWRDAGGVVEVERLLLVCGALTLDGEGTLALDKQGQPMGAMSTHIQGYDAALDRLAAAQTIDPHIAAAAKILLRALSRSNADGAATLNAPLTLQDRSLSIGPVKLLRVPPVGWLD